MKLVRCKNSFLNKKNGVCGHVVAMLTDSQVASLRTDPEGGPVFRCPGCPPDQRWIKIVDSGFGAEFKVVTPPEEFPDELVYSDQKVFHQIG